MQTMAPSDEGLKERFDRIDERILAVDRRLMETAKGTDRRFDEVNRRITEGGEETNHRFDRVEGDIRQLKNSVIAIHATLTRVGVGVGLTFASVLLSKAL